MTIKEKMIAEAFARGKADALDLRARAYDMDGTAIIAEERKVPVFDPTKDYSEWPVFSPVREGEQVFKLLQPYNAANYDGTPSTLPALWSICHTKDPAQAKPYLAPNGTSGLYAEGECCVKDGHTWKSKQNDNSWPPNEVGTESFWEDLGEKL